MSHDLSHPPEYILAGRCDDLFACSCLCRLQVYFPGWVCRYYVTSDVPKETLARLRNLSAEIMSVPPGEGPPVCEALRLINRVIYRTHCADVVSFSVFSPLPTVSFQLTSSHLTCAI